MKLVEDNARVHIHCDVINHLTEEGMNIMLRPPYSHDLVPAMQPVTFFRDRAGARSNSVRPDRTGWSTGMSHQVILLLEISHSF